MSKKIHTSHVVGPVAVAAVVLSLTLGASAQKKEFKYAVGSDATVSLVNQRGTITVKPAPGKQVLISATPASDKVEVDANQMGNRVTVRTHMVGRPAGEENKVDYEVQLPADASLSIDSGIGDVRVDGWRP